MGLIQIALIWGAVSSALFSFPAQSGEWENFKDLKEALTRSGAKRDRMLPTWVNILEYKRPDQFYDISALPKTKEHATPSSPVPAPVVVQPSSGNDTGHLRLPDSAPKL